MAESVFSAYSIFCRELFSSGCNSYSFIRDNSLFICQSGLDNPASIIAGNLTREKK